MCLFHAKMAHLPQMIISMCLLAPFIVQNFKKNAWSGSRLMTTRHFQAQNCPFAPNEDFFKKKR